MNLLPVRISELTIGQPLLWDLFNQDKKQILTQGEILSNADEALLKKSSLFRRQEETISEPESDKSASKKPNQFSFQDMRLNVGDKLQLKLPSNIRGKCCAANGGFCNAKLIG